MAKTAEQRKADQKARYAANRATVLARVKAYAETHRAAIKVYKAQWWQTNLDRNHEKQRARYQKNKDVISAKAKHQYAADPTRAKDNAKAYRAANPTKAKAAVKAWGLANPTRLAAMKLEWQRADYRLHPERYKEIQGRRKAQKQNSQVEKVDLKKILRNANGLCGICKEPLDLFGIDFDHIVPLARGGTHTTDNIQATHSHCNRAKGAKVI